MKEFQFPVRVYIEDTDAGGIVYYVNYLKFMERARTEFLRYIDHNHGDMMAEGSMFVIRDTEIQYLKPACLDDELLVSVAIDELKRTNVRFTQTIIHKEKGELIARSRLRAVCVNRDTMKPCAMPAGLADEFADYAVTPAE